MLPYEKKDTYCNYYLFSIRFNNRKERDKAHVRLRGMNVDTAKLYSETPMNARRLYGYKGDCPDSEIVADTILIIPNYYTLAEKNLIKIIDSIRKERLL
ncbi:MAG TPA: DegT/DnrJ/EryC1/StrS aminotransferase family protein [Candidatus Cloacimonetes bacterium]|nr:DegT/DnrJ/EryC1/StrS aminotransferase family protein [Candidatus Cloacimonadota bacterium]